MKLFFYGSDLLSQSEYLPVGAVTDLELQYLRQVEAHMLAVINQFGISGLAAPQIGFPIQMVTVRLAGGVKLTLLNPYIERMYSSETAYPEGCISCPPGGNRCAVARMKIIHVSASSFEKPEEVKEWHFTSRDARVVQHEIDHLHGAFFFERANLVDKAHVLEKFHLWQRTFRNDGTGFPYRGGRNGNGKRRNAAVQVAQNSMGSEDQNCGASHDRNGPFVVRG